MTPNKNDCIPEQFIFEQENACPVVVNFKGEPVTYDAGLTLIAELDRKREITSRLARCFKDYREPNQEIFATIYQCLSRIPSQSLIMTS